MSDAVRIVLQEGDAESHDGPGWYYWKEDYPEEGSVGAFAAKNEAMVHADGAGVALVFVESYGDSEPIPTKKKDTP